MKTGLSIQRLKLFYIICIAFTGLFLILLLHYVADGGPDIWIRQHKSHLPMHEAAPYAASIPRTSVYQITQLLSASSLSATRVTPPMLAQVTQLQDIPGTSLTSAHGKEQVSIESGTLATKAHPTAVLRFDNVSGDLTTVVKLTGPGNDKATVTSLSARNNTSAPTLATATGNAAITDLEGKFKPSMSVNESMVFTRTLRTLANSLQTANVTYFLCGGTLLGAYRHRGMIPWDDDMDIIANFSQEPELRRALEVVPGYTLDLWSTWLYKFYAVDALDIRGRKWKWPFIDVYLFKETATHVFDFPPPPRDNQSYLKQDVFPLVSRPFDGLWLPVPAQEQKIVNQEFGLKYCQSNTYSHRHESQIPTADIHTVPCEYLYKIHPFVFRNSTELPIKETVKIGDTVVAEYIFPH